MNQTDSQASPKKIRDAMREQLQQQLQLDHELFDILEEIAIGRSNAAIATKLNIRPRTLEGKVALVYAALGVQNDKDTNQRAMVTYKFWLLFCKLAQKKWLAQ